MKEKVLAIIAEHFDLDPAALGEDTNLLEDLHADSLDLVELIMAFEENFDISIPDEVALSVKTVGDVIAYLEKAE